MSFSILIVDESPVMRQVIGRIISLSKLPPTTCFTADGGQQALDLLEKQAVDLILTDTQMEKMNGEQLADRLQKDPSLCHIPYLVISADGTSTSVQHMLDRGASGYLAKPFTPGMLRSELTRLLAGLHG